VKEISLFFPGETGLHSLHPLTKAAITGFSLIVAAVMPLYWMVAIYFALVLLPLALWGRIGKRFLATCAKVIWPFMLSLFPIQGFFAPGHTVLFEIGQFTYTIEGMLLAMDYTVRILVGISAALLLMFVTRPDHLMQALVERGVPHQLGYIVVTTLQIIPRFQAKAQMILNAQRSRGLETEGSLTHRLRMLLPLVGPLILGSIIDIDERAVALEARAFNFASVKTHLYSLHDSRMQVRLRRIALLGVLGMVVWRVLSVFDQ